jgi:hypothetical protein
MARLLCLLASVALFASSAHAKLPDDMIVHGKLTSEAGTAVDGTYALVLALYGASSSGVSLETAAVEVDVTDGVFSASLPIATAAAASDSLWLGITLAGEPEMPRVPLASVPFARAAARLACSGCVTAEMLSGPVAFLDIENT